MLQPDEEYMLAKRYLEHDDRDAAHKAVQDAIDSAARPGVVTSEIRAALVEKIPPILRRFILGKTDSEVLFYMILGKMQRRCELHRRGYPLEDLAAAAREAIDEVIALAGPICEDDKLRIVTYVFGHRLPASGRCVTTRKELRQLGDHAGGDMTAYVVEACPECRWHHLLRILPL